MKYTHLDIVVRRDPAEIHDLVDLALLGSVCLKKMISTGVFVLAVCALRRSIKGFLRKSSMIFTHIRQNEAAGAKRELQVKNLSKAGNGHKAPTAPPQK